jgi:hypothetical protein
MGIHNNRLNQEKFHTIFWQKTKGIVLQNEVQRTIAAVNISGKFVDLFS